MSGWEDELADAFLTEVPAGSEDASIDRLVTETTPGAIAPRPAVRAAILEGAILEGRFHRFSDAVANVLDLSADRAREILDGLDRPSSWVAGPLPQTRLYHVEGGPKVRGAATGFVRMTEGAEFPDHEHLGDEVVVVIQGSLLDGVTGAIARPGDVVKMAAGSSHHFTARPGPHLVYLLVLQGGVRIGDVVIRADDPRV